MRHVDFENPPVVETVLGVQFEPIPGWNIIHYGLYWPLIAKTYPTCETKSWVPGPDIERFGAEIGAVRQRPNVELIEHAEARLVCSTESGDRALQIQREHFVHNWRRVGDAPYPQYEKLQPLFADEWSRFVLFLAEHKLPAPVVRQCEVTYVNHIERGQGWETAADLGEVSPFLRPTGAAAFLPMPEALALHATYEMPRQLGRLRVSMQPAIRHVDLKQVLQLTLTARGRPERSDLDSVLRWLDIGREWVVKGFKDFTTAKMQAQWGIRR